MLTLHAVNCLVVHYISTTVVNIIDQCQFCRYTYEIAPVYTTIERIVIEKMCSLVGYSETDGIFSPGNFKWDAFVMGKFGLLISVYFFYKEIF